MLLRRLGPLLALVFLLSSGCARSAERITAQQAAALIEQGQAVLVDVREPAEWKQTGVAAPAELLAKSDFDGARRAWAPFLERHGKDKTLLLICRSGRRSGIVADALAAEGYKTLNVGAFSDWAAAGLPVRPVAP